MPIPKLHAKQDDLLRRERIEKEMIDQYLRRDDVKPARYRFSVRGARQAIADSSPTEYFRTHGD